MVGVVVVVGSGGGVRLLERAGGEEEGVGRDLGAVADKGLLGFGDVDVW